MNDFKELIIDINKEYTKLLFLAWKQYTVFGKIFIFPFYLMVSAFSICFILSYICFGLFLKRIVIIFKKLFYKS